MPCFRCSKILGQAGKQGILQQMFRKFWISNRLLIYAFAQYRRASFHMEGRLEATVC